MESSVGDHVAESIPNGAPYLVFISYIYLSLTYNVFTANQPQYLYNLISFGKSSESVQCAIAGPCLRMRHRPSA